MMKKYSKGFTSVAKQNVETKGFTLIELLLVIVIIGILAGVLISVINPAIQQQKARNATIQSALSRSGYAIQAYFAANGANPSGTAFLAQLNQATQAGTSCAAAATCFYFITGVTTPSTCTVNTSNGSGAGATNPCAFAYVGTAVPFTLTVRMFNVNNTLTNPAYRYDGNGQSSVLASY